MNPPIADRIAHLLCSFVADTGGEVNEKLTITILGSPRAKSIPQKIKLNFRIIPSAIIVFTIHDPRFIRMQLKAAFLKTLM